MFKKLKKFIYFILLIIVNIMFFVLAWLLLGVILFIIAVFKPTCFCDCMGYFVNAGKLTNYYIKNKDKRGN
jgi:uncharacterized membrane protein YdbT with pleckstrin-like domain